MDQSQRDARNELVRLMNGVYDQRAAKIAAADRVTELEQKLYATPEYKELQVAKESHKSINAMLTQIEQTARQAIADFYVKTGERTPVNGAGVRVMKRLRYNVGEAMAWAYKNLPAALTLNVDVYEKLAPMIEGAPIVVEEEPTGTIASKLEYSELF